jgi:crotonobetainyl-CoA:carnitine CoA-transferase CaiB-like acyl-CoA transferase
VSSMRGNVTPPAQGFLHGLTVLELGDGLAGAAATATLRTFGAQVTTFVDPRSAFRRARPSSHSANGSDPSLLSLLLDREKERAEPYPRTLAELTSSIERGPVGRDGSSGYDLIVTDRVASAPYSLMELNSAANYVSWVKSVNAGAWVTISAFGLSGERSNDYATELTIGAATSLLTLVKDPATGAPLKLAGNQTLFSTAQAGALAACHAIDLSRGGRPIHLDLSAQEATIAAGPMLEFARLLLGCNAPAGAKRYGAPAGFYRCTDGLVRIAVMEDHQWQGVVRALGSPSWAERFDETKSRIEFANEIDERIAAWTAAMSKAEAETVLQEAAVPATAMYRPSEILDSPQLAHRGSLESSVVGDGVVVRSVGRPFPNHPSAATNSSAARQRTLRDLRVLEASHVLAVPLCGALLGALGAKVTKLEDINRIDMYRRRGPYINGVEGINRAAYFAMVNHSKASLAVDLNGDTTKLKQLVMDADVVIENIGLRRAERFGITAALEGRMPEKLGVSSSGFGHTGPYADYRAYAYNLQTSCGLGYLTRNVAGEPADIDLAWADLVSAYTLATIVAAWAVGPEGNAGTVVDFAMAEVIDARFNEYLAAASLDPDSDGKVDRANAVSPFAPSGVYPTSDGWIALSVDGDDAFTQLCKVLDIESDVAGEQFDSVEHRLDAHLQLDAVMAQAFVGDASTSWTEKLRIAGVYCERVVSASDLIDDPHLIERGYFTAVSHPESGTLRLLGIPWRCAGEHAIALTSPPLLVEPEPATSPNS